MPTPEEAARILRAHFGMVSDPADPETMVGDPTGSIALAGYRGAEESELQDRIANDASGMALQSEGFVPGEPGRRSISRLPAANLASDRVRLGALQHEQDADPFTGLEEQGRVRTIQDKLDTAATIQRPEIGDAAETLAKRNYFAEFMKNKGLKMGEYAAGASPEAFAAGMTPVRVAASAEAQGNKDADLAREQRKLMSPSLQPGQLLKPGAAVGSQNPNDYLSQQNNKPLSAAELKPIQTMAGVAPMLLDLKAMLDPTKNQVTNRATQTLRLALYNMGVSPNMALVGGDEKSQARIQLADLIKIMGASPFMAGSRNYQYMKDIYRHLTNPAATDAFLYQQISELEKRWPQIQDAIIQMHRDPTQPIFQGGGETPDESTAQDVASQLASDPTPEEKAAAAKRR